VSNEIPINFGIKSKNSKAEEQFFRSLEKTSWNNIKNVLAKGKLFSIRDSDIPLDILFNYEINQIKAEEHELNSKPKPITFTIEGEYENSHSFNEDVKFEIEGGGKAIQTSFVRK
jgi:hypothetical protein